MPDPPPRFDDVEDPDGDGVGDRVAHAAGVGDGLGLAFGVAVGVGVGVADPHGIGVEDGMGVPVGVGAVVVRVGPAVGDVVAVVSATTCSGEAGPLTSATTSANDNVASATPARRRSVIGERPRAAPAQHVTGMPRRSGMCLCNCHVPSDCSRCGRESGAEATTPGVVVACHVVFT